MIDLDPIGELHLAQARRHLTAGSGLVSRDGHLFVISDEELALAAFEGGDPAAGRLHALADAELPEEPAERKAAKPDLEALCELPPTPAWPHGALLALGSGATEQRERGWLCPLGEGCRLGEPIEISLSDVYERLRAELDDLNVEGAAVAGDRLWLAQRGNGARGVNALVALDLGPALRGLAERRALPAKITGLTEYELGSMSGVMLGFSDLAPLPDGRLAFTAVAEAGESTYLDGDCVGAALGTVEPGARRVPALLPLSEPHKVEGLAVTGLSGQRASLLFVADPDDPARPAPLFAASADLP